MVFLEDRRKDNWKTAMGCLGETVVSIPHPHASGDWNLVYLLLYILSQERWEIELMNNNKNFEKI